MHNNGKILPISKNVKYFFMWHRYDRTTVLLIMFAFRHHPALLYIR
uniref:Uncharacterized protein n=1 Tax=Anguilla anguilla TaxID=7936 RepID=A0A0E9RV17_ANGAN